jgi:hypothetical protein
VGIKAILGGVLEVRLGAGMETFRMEGVVGTVRDNESCEKDMVRDLHSKFCVTAAVPNDQV